ncbi:MULTISPECIES: indole-3-glycerol phosphate synthase TrpC [unclassified Paenibacillus]|uniref:Indole-3-glycerol phosphate synthase n=1 Tax=Paenibacillus provencensis TaxID=441151 RepID=A0ABW3PLX8_9BACL|nr:MULTISPECIES: indole-3-glycerol phosphate synthase TrpC [unclassified Paenibacillus]MCM3126567.1 indole-3-glycerol phosphate synthase TrpC [Paenibacillus sp. MER 78]SFS59233.1 indole-3-glycerol phosphate synthase [Paenibacillus sp. 453mf]
MYLDRIVATKKEEVAALSSLFNRTEAEKTIAALPATRGFEKALSKEHVRGMGLIAEVKKASPSKGLIRSDFDPVDIAKAYENAGADCMSVLTDVNYFQGKPEYLTEISRQVRVPLLRKDFIIDEIQIAEARIIGADAVLLIASILSSAQLSRYISYAKDLGLDALVEVHDKEELLSVLDIGSASLIGINNRNLRTFETRLETTAELAGLVPEYVTLISESGIRTPQDVDYVKQAGAKGILVGEQFMRQDNVSQAVLELMGAGK